eukprot:5186173-Amphidinium_carterae.1
MTVSASTCTFPGNFPFVLHLLSALSTASLATTTHSKLLVCNAKANKANVLKPKLGKLATCPGVFRKQRSCVPVQKSKIEWIFASKAIRAWRIGRHGPNN